ncbi:hypothetical protein O181_026609 [Austropuccinia psidii MF-1]|uniref:Metal-dependent protein hydrolase n=1 Tax=Austropuccinia psidii MF-1 TaxID=1389203 RepID=A0A9Q3H1S6_9BASI|nr:hypothetical protein [Austropuccinia psidii MF-1]
MKVGGDGFKECRFFAPSHLQSFANSIRFNISQSFRGRIEMSTIEPQGCDAKTNLIGTHSGTFHADEALAVSLLRSLDRFKSSRLVRTRDPAVLETCDVVVDVGGKYDPACHRYDHHQRGFEETYSSDHNTKLSSAGLIYKHFGPEIIANYLGLSVGDPALKVLVPKLYKVFVEGIDGVDNGVERYEAVDINGKPVMQSIRPKYTCATDLSSRISYLNPNWNEPITNEILDAKFEEASALAGAEFFSRLDYFAKAWLPVRDLVEKALNNRFKNQVDEFGRVLIFDSSCPWKDHLHTLEKSLSANPMKSLPLYVLYPDESQKWRIQAIPKIPGGFESRCIFVHASGFIGGNETFEGAVKMVQRALQAKE